VGPGTLPAGTGVANVAVGGEALMANQSGSANVAIGGPTLNPNFDFDTGNSAIEVIIPWVIPAASCSVSTSPSACSAGPRIRRWSRSSR
jgi:hypothetical protein